MERSNSLKKGRHGAEAEQGKLGTCQTFKKRTEIIFVICLFPVNTARKESRDEVGVRAGTEQMGKGSCSNTAPVSTQGFLSSAVVYKLWNTGNFLQHPPGN